MESTIPEKLASAIALQQQGKNKDSQAVYIDILAEHPEHESASVNLGILYFEQERYEEGFALLENATKHHPKSANARFNLAYAFMQRSSWESAIEHFQLCIALEPHHFQSHLYLANCLHSLGDFSTAFDHFSNAYRIEKDSSELLNNWILCCINLKRFDKAENILEKALDLFPSQWELYGNQGTLFKEKWQLAAAEKAFKKAISLGGDNWQVYHSLGAVYHNWNKKEEALNCLKIARSLNPTNEKLHSDYLYHLNYYPEVSNQNLFDEHVKWGELHAPKSNILISKETFSTPPPLKVGFLSADFCYHPVSIFLLGWLDKINAEKMTFHAYAEVRNRDGYTDRIKSACTSWTETNRLSNQQVAEKIMKDGIHVLIDLAGHTKGNRLQVMSYKAAPLQASYLGYINTTGVSQVDYRIVNQFVNPPDSQIFYSEKLAYLPQSYTCYEPVNLNIKIQPTPALHNGFVTFGSFNNPTKINSSVAQLWARLLQELPGSKLLLKARHFLEEEGQQPVIALFEKDGIEKDRLIFEGPSELMGYLEAHNKVDIALDTFPHNGGTTTHDALLMGVPVVGLAGNSYVSRMGVSIMQHLGYPEWVSQSENQFIENVVGMASDLEKLNKIRMKLREKFLSSPLCDGQHFANQMEDLLFEMWENNDDQSPPVNLKIGR